MFAKSSAVQIRLLLYSASLLLYVVNGLVMFYSVHFGEAMQNPDAKLKLFFSMSYRFISTWNMVFQAAYVLISLCCEINMLKGNGQEIEFRVFNEKVRNRIFCGIVWPITVIVSGLFWSIYLYDQEMLLPKYTEIVISKASNHVVHTAIIIFALLELAYNPKKPQDHWKNLKVFYAVFTSYIAVIYFTLWQRGVYPYILMNLISHREVFLILSFLYILGPIIYGLQWVLTPVLRNYVENRAKVF